MRLLWRRLDRWARKPGGTRPSSSCSSQCRLSAERGRPARLPSRAGHIPSVGLWKKTFLQRGPEVFFWDGSVQVYERQIPEFEQLLGKKAAEIALPQKWGFPPESAGREWWLITARGLGRAR